MRTERLDVWTADSQRVAVWRSSPEIVSNDAPVVVLAQGFGRSMRHGSIVAHYLVSNGATVYRYDPVRWVGLSDGEISNWSFTPLLDSMHSVVNHAVEQGAERVSLVTISLASRVALRCMSRDPRIQSLTALVGVIDCKDTLERALGVDYFGKPYAEIPDAVQFEGHTVDPRVIWRDDEQHNWSGLDGVLEDLEQIRKPVSFIQSTHDEWVDLDHLKRVLGATKGPRRVVELPFAEHDLVGNPVARRMALCRLVEVSLGFADTPGTASGVQEPGFSEILEVMVAERKRHKLEEKALREGIHHRQEAVA